MSQTSNSVLAFEQARVLMAQAITAYKPSRKIVRFEFLITPIDQIRWLAAQNAVVKIYGANHEDTACIAGIGEAVSLRAKGSVRYRAVFQKLRSTLDPQYPYLQWYGGFGFDPKVQDKAWSHFGSCRFVIPRFELARDKSRMIFCCNLKGKVNKQEILSELRALKVDGQYPAQRSKIVKRLDHPDEKRWARSVGAVLANIQEKTLQKVVLARKTDFLLNTAVDPWAMLHQLKKVTPNSYHFAFSFDGVTFLGASPESLFKRTGRKLSSEALAGTKPARTSPSVLLDSKKDQHEHHIVVDAIRNSLGPLCRHLKVGVKPDIKALSNGIHLHTHIEGELNVGVADEDVLAALHPTPALGGMPRVKGLQAIRKLEPFNRGWYGGPLGYVGLDWAEFVVGIRSGLVQGKKLSVFAGAGIVEGSTPLDEWAEVENKISNFLKIAS